ncbi:transglutaminase-like cysteine peptidase [Psychromonas hadalis]|uniref:transglutaminase-like cysteine peptidase n=1 Tax=Psychromonas hadalis TaxID=211669 RepID=UPI0003B77F57|nr:transglutaminase-like cysteine peptidase [Psychromonas hadalis]
MKSLPFSLAYRAVMISVLLLITASLLYAKKGSELNEQQIVAALVSNYGERAGKRGKAWFRVMGKSYALDEFEQLKNVNNFFNLLRFTDDIKLWGVSNYWATPIEFLGVNAGDCEDFAIAKYFTLLELGIPDKKMRITMVKAVKLNQYHMVVAYYETPGSIPLILDNIDGRIKPATQRPDLIPVYSFNGKQLWLNKQKGQDVLAGKSERLKRWTNLNQRMGISNLKQPKSRME